MAGDCRQLLPTAVTLVLGLLAVWGAPVVAAQEGARIPPELAALDQALAHWDRSALVALTQTPSTAIGTLASGCLALLDGDLETVERLGLEAAQQPDQEVRARGEWLLNTAVSWRSVLGPTAALSTGAFTLRVPTGQEEWGRRILPYAQTLIAATRSELGIPPETRADIVFLPDTDSLARVAGIPPGQLLASGTVATTLFGRIFLLTPAAFQNGYPWHIVLAHEAVHDGCQRRTPGKLPHFLEEGIATLLEERAVYHRWRTYSPMERALLFLANEQKILLSPEALDAPYWELPDALHARLAFLQALAGALVLQHKGPDGAITAFFDALAVPETTWSQAMEQTTGLKEKAFSARMKKRWANMASREYLPSLLYSDGQQWLSEKGQRATRQATSTVALGDLLWGRGHLEAALRMYDRVAPELQPTPDMVWRVARLLIDVGRAQEALPHVLATLERHPRDARVHYVAALVYQALNQTDNAHRAAREAWLLNPFAQQTGELFADSPLEPSGEQEEATP
jgi:tetratricopeptide (TPR) repeat protein